LERVYEAKVCVVPPQVAAIGDPAPMIELLGLFLATLASVLRSRQRLLLDAYSDGNGPAIPIQGVGVHG
jgi:hypothetical protein